MDKTRSLILFIFFFCLFSFGFCFWGQHLDFGQQLNVARQTKFSFGSFNKVYAGMYDQVDCCMSSECCSVVGTITNPGEIFGGDCDSCSQWHDGTCPAGWYCSTECGVACLECPVCQTGSGNYCVPDSSKNDTACTDPSSNQEGVCNNGVCDTQTYCTTNEAGAQCLPQPYGNPGFGPCDNDSECNTQTYCTTKDENAKCETIGNGGDPDNGKCAPPDDPSSCQKRYLYCDTVSKKCAYWIHEGPTPVPSDQDGCNAPGEPCECSVDPFSGASDLRNCKNAGYLWYECQDDNNYKGYTAKCVAGECDDNPAGSGKCRENVQGATVSYYCQKVLGNPGQDIFKKTATDVCKFTPITNVRQDIPCAAGYLYEDIKNCPGFIGRVCNDKKTGIAYDNLNCMCAKDGSSCDCVDDKKTVKTCGTAPHAPVCVTMPNGNEMGRAPAVTVFSCVVGDPPFCGNPKLQVGAGITCGPSKQNVPLGNGQCADFGSPCTYPLPDHPVCTYNIHDCPKNGGGHHGGGGGIQGACSAGSTNKCEDGGTQTCQVSGSWQPCDTSPTGSCWVPGSPMSPTPDLGVWGDCVCPNGQKDPHNVCDTNNGGCTPSDTCGTDTSDCSKCCPSGKTDPHNVCNPDGTCTKSNTCDTNADCSKCCPPGQTNPHDVCNANGTCGPVNTCGKTTSCSTCCPTGQSNPYSQCKNGVCTPFTTCGVPDCSACGCPDGQTNPHNVCNSDGTCGPVNTCGKTTSCSACSCPTGQINPHNVCNSDGTCGPVNSCGATTNCSTCCLTGQSNPRNVCNSDGTCSTSNSCGTSVDCQTCGCDQYSKPVCPCGGQPTCQSDGTWSQCPDKHAGCLYGTCQCLDGPANNNCFVVGAQCQSKCGCDQYGGKICDTEQTGNDCTNASSCPACPILCVGRDCACTGPYCVCIGSDCPCTGPYCNCTGSDCSCTGPYCACTGPDCACTGPYCNCTGPDCPCVGPYCNCTGPDCVCIGPNCPCTGPYCACTGPDCDCTGPLCVCNGPDCNNTNDPPVVSGLTASSGNYCAITGIPGSGLATFHWSYGDTENDAQVGWQLQVSTSSGSAFDNGIIYDSCLINGGNNCATNGNANTVPFFVFLKTSRNTDSCAPDCNFINYGAKYYWRVKVWEDNGQSSDWTYYTGSYIYPYAHPGPAVSFTPPTNVMPEDLATFFDVNSTCFNDDGTTYLCANSDSNTYQWWFDYVNNPNDPNDNSGVINCSSSDPTVCNTTSHTYAQPGTYTAKLQVHDEIGYGCTYSKSFRVGPSSANQVPQWQEISPFK